MATDAELLSRYAVRHDERAFGALVQRHLTLVYSVALRQVGGDAHLAQDVTQRVFTDLARKAPELSRRVALGGWLCRATHFAASDLVRAERARRTREQEAQLMQELSRELNAAADWDKLRPVLDIAINELGETDRDAVVLRFFEAKPFAQIGATLRVTEDAARMRVDRALEKLRTALARRGVTSTSAALTAVLTNQFSTAAPAGLAVSITGAATASAAGAGAAVVLMGMTKVQIAIAGSLAAVFATAFIVQGNANASLQREISALAPPPQSAAALRAENQRLASTLAEVELLRDDDLELKQLAERVADAKRAHVEQTRLEQARTQGLRQQFYERVQDDETRAQAEMERMTRELQALLRNYLEAVATSRDTTQSADARAQAEATAKAKREVIKAKEGELQAFIQNVRKALSQRIEAFQRLHGDDPSVPPPQFKMGAGRVEAQRVPADNTTLLPTK